MRDIERVILERSKENEKKIRRCERARYRNRQGIDNKKKENKKKSENTWFIIGETIGVLFVQPTLGGELSKMVGGLLADFKPLNRGRTSVIEVGEIPSWQKVQSCE